MRASPPRRSSRSGFFCSPAAGKARFLAFAGRMSISSEAACVSPTRRREQKPSSLAPQRYSSWLKRSDEDPGSAPVAGPDGDAGAELAGGQALVADAGVEPGDIVVTVGEHELAAAGVGARSAA